MSWIAEAAPGPPIPIAEPRSQTGRRPSSRASSARVSTTAAAPSPIGAHISAVTGSATIHEPSTSSTVTGFVYCASGLSAAWRRFLTAIRASVSRSSP